MQMSEQNHKWYTSAYGFCFQLKFHPSIVRIKLEKVEG